MRRGLAIRAVDGLEKASGNHRITESLREEKTTKIPKSNPTSFPPGPLNHVPQSLISMVLKHLQRWGLPHLPGQPVPLLDHFSDNKLPNIQPGATWGHPLSPYCCCLGAQTNLHLATTFQVTVEIHEASLTRLRDLNHLNSLTRSP